MTHKFYNSWRNKTPLEKKYIKALQNAVEWIKKQIFIDDVVSAYFKGSMALREINERSDIDLMLVVKKSSQLERVKEIRNAYKEELKPVDILPISLEELKSNERFFKTEMKGRPDQDTIFLHYYKLVYGKKISTKGFKMRNIEKIRDNLKSAIIKKFIPMRERGEFGFSQLMKLVAHLIYWDVRIEKKKDLAPSWKALIKETRGKNELLNKLYHYRLNHTKDANIREDLMKEVKKYLGVE